MTHQERNRGTRKWHIVRNLQNILSAHTNREKQTGYKTIVLTNVLRQKRSRSHLDLAETLKYNLKELDYINSRYINSQLCKRIVKDSETILEKGKNSIAKITFASMLLIIVHIYL